MDCQQLPNYHSRSKLIRCARWLGAVFGILLVLSGMVATGLYLARERVAAFVAQKYLARYGIESTIEFSTVGWSGFVARVRAGSPGSPEFTADGVQVFIAYPGNGVSAIVTPMIRQIRLIRPTLSVSFDGSKISFGALQPLIDELMEQPSVSPRPDIVVENGTLFLKTPYGPVTAKADAVIANGVIRNLNAQLRRTELKGNDFAVQLDGGSLLANASGDVVKLRTALKLDAVSLGQRSARNIALQTDAEIHWNANGDSLAVDIAALKGTVQASEWNAMFSRGAESSAAFELRDTTATLQGGKLKLAGRGEVRSRSGGFHYFDANIAEFTSKDSLSAFAFEVSRAGWRVTSNVHTASEGRGIVYPITGDQITVGSAQVTLDGALAAGSEGFRAGFRGNLTANGAFPRHQLTLRTLSARVDGSITINQAQTSFGIRTSLAADTQMPISAAEGIARTIPAMDHNLASSVANAMRSAHITTGELVIRGDQDEFTIGTRTPAVVAGADGARITLRPYGNRALADQMHGQISGAFLLDTAQGTLPLLRLDVTNYRYAEVNGRPNGTAQIHIQTALDYGPFRKLTMAAAGRVKLSAGELSLALDGCSDTEFDAFAPAGNALITHARMQFCGVAGHPEIVAGKNSWTIDSHVQLRSAEFPAAGTAVADASGDVQFSGRGTQILTGLLLLTRATVSDAAKDPRFRPLSAAGMLKATGSEWHGLFRLGTQKHVFANIDLRHSSAAGMGEADIDAQGLDFQSNEFQPENIAPFLAAFGSRVRGRADFTGRVAWSKNGIGSSSGRLVLRNVDFQSRAGMARQTSVDLAFDSLLPVRLHPSQTVTIGRVEMVVPLENVAITFSYTPEALRVERAVANVAGGHASLDQLEYKLVPNATTSGRLRLQDIDPMPLIAAAGLENHIRVTARIEGEIPFTTGPAGLRFNDGHIAAQGPGRLALTRDALTASAGIGPGNAAPPNAVQDFAYQALENLAFERLDGTVNSRPMGRVSILLHIIGRHDPAVGAEPRVGIIDLLRGHAFDKPLPLPKGTPIDLTLDTSVNLDELLNSWLSGFRESVGSARAPN